MVMIGIYKITNLVNRKNYIGQSIHIEKRWKEHCKESSNSLISQAIKKYGRENFSFSVLEEAEKSQLNDLEKKYIIIFNSIVPNEYNILTGADSDYTSFGKYDLETFKHIINDIKYSSLTLDEIAMKYSLCRRTITRINNGEVHHLDDENYPLRKNQYNGFKQNDANKIHKCLICGKETINQKYCSQDCLHIAQRKSERPSRQELKTMIREYPFTKIASFYNVKDNTIRKWCKNYDLPFRRKDIKKFSEQEWQII